MLACPQHAATVQIKRQQSKDGSISMNKATGPMQVLKEKATKEKQKLVDTCVSHSLLHLYLLIRKIKAIDC